MMKRNEQRFGIISDEECLLKRTVLNLLEKDNKRNRMNVRYSEEDQVWSDILYEIR